MQVNHTPMSTHPGTTIYPTMMELCSQTQRRVYCIFHTFIWCVYWPPTFRCQWTATVIVCHLQLSGQSILKILAPLWNQWMMKEHIGLSHSLSLSSLHSPMHSLWIPHGIQGEFGTPNKMHLEQIESRWNMMFRNLEGIHVIHMDSW